jgi:DNA (cytosine-5)-methyltransferase 1
MPTKVLETLRPPSRLATAPTFPSKNGSAAKPIIAVSDLELFSGGGGLAVGLNEVGFSPIGHYEYDPHACKTLRLNSSSANPTVSGPVHEGNALEIDWKKIVEWGHVKLPVRLLAGGAPCQPFSLGGKHKAQHDGRNLFPEVVTAIRNLRPKAVFLENVRGLLRNGFQPYFEYILRQLECPSIAPRPNELWQSHNERIRRHQCSSGYQPEYHVQWRHFDAADFGVPQNRQRVFIIATADGLPRYRFPDTTHSRDALIRAQESGEYWKRHGLRKPRSMGDLATNRDDGKLPWVTVRDGLSGLPEPAICEEESTMNHWLIPGARRYPGHGGSSLDWPSKTIKAGVHGVPGGENTLVDDNGKLRYYTLREAARIQTFPDHHFFEGARIHVTRQIGNAVPCKLAAAVARPLFALLESNARSAER